MYLALGLAGEAGEIADKVAKQYRDGVATVDKEAVFAEMGDVMWYMSQLANLMGVSLMWIMQKNAEKLTSRKARGVLGGSGDDR